MAPRNKICSEKLVQLINNFPYLYDFADRDYKNQPMKDDRWLWIAAQLKVSDIDRIKIRWKSLKDRYRREKTEYENMRKSGKIVDDSQPPSRWRLYGFLDAFLGSCMVRRRGDYNSVNKETSRTDDHEARDGDVTNKSMLLPSIELQSVLETASIPVLHVDQYPQASNLSLGLNNISASNSETVSLSQSRSHSPDIVISQCASISQESFIRNSPKNHRFTNKGSRNDNVDRQIASTLHNINSALRGCQSAMCQSAAITSQNDEKYLYGQYLISRFNNLLPQQFHKAKKGIEDVLFAIEEEKFQG